MVKLACRSKKDLDSLPEALAAKAKEFIRRLDRDPSQRKRLVGPLRDKRSARLGWSHRIIYKASEGQIIVLTISPRRDAYR